MGRRIGTQRKGLTRPRGRSRSGAAKALSLGRRKDLTRLRGRSRYDAAKALSLTKGEVRLFGA